jgi:plasmid stabilization system protein ParE
MVCYSDTAKSDLRNILWGLANWEVHPLGYELAEKYVEEIRTVCDNLDKKQFHLSAIYETHKKYGSKVHTYTRNARTTRYIIYNKIDSNIYINKIISNYLTKS